MVFSSLFFVFFFLALNLIAYHFADGGLCIVQALRRPCKASRIDRSDKGEVFQKMVFH